MNARAPSPGNAATARPTRLQVDLARRIAQELRDGDFEIGAHLSEKSLTERYEVSRTPVRGALKLLSAQGLVSFRPNNGYFVRALSADTSLPPVESGGVTADELYRRLIDDRRSRTLEESFTDRDLMQRYGVPRSVLVKTLVRLAADGLIEKRHGHGWRFPMSLENTDVRAESYRFRIMVECAGLMESSFKANRPMLARMRAEHELLIADEGAPIPTHRFFELNATFHEMVAQFSGNRFVLQSVQQQNQLRQLDKHPAFYEVPDLARYIGEHLEIINALEAGDQEWAAAIMRRHLKASQWAA